MKTPLSLQLAKSLRAAGYTAADIGRALDPSLPRNAVYKAGMRVLSGSALDVDRLGDLARGLGATVTIGPLGLAFQAPAHRPNT